MNRFTLTASGFAKPDVRRLLTHASTHHNVTWKETKISIFTSHFEVQGDYIPVKALYDVLTREGVEV